MVGMLERLNLLVDGAEHRSRGREQLEILSRQRRYRLCAHQGSVRRLPRLVSVRPTTALEFVDGICHGKLNLAPPRLDSSDPRES